jgi:hypothetical protein
MVVFVALSVLQLRRTVVALEQRTVSGPVNDVIVGAAGAAVVVVVRSVVVVRASVVVVVEVDVELDVVVDELSSLLLPARSTIKMMIAMTTMIAAAIHHHFPPPPPLPSPSPSSGGNGEPGPASPTTGMRAVESTDGAGRAAAPGMVASGSADSGGSGGVVTPEIVRPSS